MARRAARREAHVEALISVGAPVEPPVELQLVDGLVAGVEMELVALQTQGWLVHAQQAAGHGPAGVVADHAVLLHGVVLEDEGALLVPWQLKHSSFVRS
jgi:hypothetical protein